MALPSSGAISLSQVNTEMGKTASTAITMNDSGVRTLAGKSSGAVSMSDLRGKSWLLPPTIAYSKATGNTDVGYSPGYYALHFSIGGGAVSSVTGAFTSGGSRMAFKKQSNTEWRLSLKEPARYSKDTGTFRVTATNAAGSASASRTVTLIYSDLSGGCCFTGDSLVTMYDGSYKRIDTILPGDLIKTPFGYSEVDWIRLPMLADRPLLSMSGGKCKTSGEHNIWAKHPVTGEQWWATRDMERWAFERDYELGPGLNGMEPIDLIGLGCTKATYATEDGWKETEWFTVEDASPDTQLYHLYLKDHASYFVDGYLVIGELPRIETAIDWTQFNWNPEKPQQPVYMTYDYELPEVDRSAFKRITRVELTEIPEE